MAIQRGKREVATVNRLEALDSLSTLRLKDALGQPPQARPGRFFLGGLIGLLFKCYLLAAGILCFNRLSFSNRLKFARLKKELKKKRVSKNRIGLSDG